MDNDYTPQQRLQEVNKAIQAVLLGGQSYKIGSRSLTRADLALLRAMRDDLEAPVSYTHLDVYKRQALCDRCRAEGRHPAGSP